MLLIDLISDFAHLFYPRVCSACNGVLLRHEEVICSDCIFHLPKTNYHLGKENPIEKIFWGRIPIESASAYYYFKKGNKVQNLLHKFKYKNYPEIGIYIGKLYGSELKNSLVTLPDIIIPIPLHVSKKKKRGYNQSEKFGIGLSEAMGIPQNTDNFIRKVFTETQTRKNRFSRWENVKEIFHCQDSKIFENKHILLIDDVITTGSTLEASARKLLEIEGVKISIACMACATI